MRRAVLKAVLIVSCSEPRAESVWRRGWLTLVTVWAGALNLRAGADRRCALVVFLPPQEAAAAAEAAAEVVRLQQEVRRQEEDVVRLEQAVGDLSGKVPKCPIWHCEMRDPVALKCGHVMSQEAIDRWWGFTARSARACPMCQAPQPTRGGVYTKLFFS